MKRLKMAGVATASFISVCVIAWYSPAYPYIVPFLALSAVWHIIEYSKLIKEAYSKPPTILIYLNILASLLAPTGGIIYSMGYIIGWKMVLATFILLVAVITPIFPSFRCNCKKKIDITEKYSFFRYAASLIAVAFFYQFGYLIPLLLAAVWFGAEQTRATIKWYSHDKLITITHIAYTITLLPLYVASMSLSIWLLIISFPFIIYIFMANFYCFSLSNLTSKEVSKWKEEHLKMKECIG